MLKSTERLAEGLIKINVLRPEKYLEIANLDPGPFVDVYVRTLAFRETVRRLRRQSELSHAKAQRA